MPKIFILLFFLPTFLYSQSPTVPSRMEFAGIKLRLMDDAREEIQKDVDALTKSPKYFNIKVERAKTYFPIIERVFREEGLHDDFKYLVLQESALISDAVSTSDAVGFWQFKDFTAMEVGLRVDNHIDERMNIVSSSRGAAKYLQKNNLYFDNWLHSLQAYQMGAGGAMRVLDKKEKGSKSMVIDKKTYWYVKKYLAHKVAFEGAVNGVGEIKLLEYMEGKNKSLKDISHETEVSLEQLETYNKWLKRGKIPEDKVYTVLLPVKKLDNINIAALETGPKADEKRLVEYKFPKEQFPTIGDRNEALSGNKVEINGIMGVLGKTGDKVALLARKGDVDLSKFLKYNDMDITDPIIDGQAYYFQKKKAKAQAHYYVAKQDETLWSISQKFGVQLKKLKIKNRIRDDEDIKEGRVLWLRYIRPAKIDIEYRKVEPKPIVKPFIKENTPEPIPAPVDAKLVKPVTLTPIDSVKISQSKAEPINLNVGDKDDDEPVIENEPDSLQTFDNRDLASIEPEKQHNENEEEDNDDLIEEIEIKKIHSVQPGETLYALSKQYQVTVRQLLEWNKLNITDGISIGQKIIIIGKPKITPKKTEVQETDEQEKVEVKFTYHEVMEGDTLYKIARSYNVTIEELMAWNNKKDFNISPGDKIKVRKGHTLD